MFSYCQLDLQYFPESHTATNIQNHIDKIFSDLGIGKENAKIVTDSGANMKAACKSYDWMPCYCHKLNTAISKAWSESLAESAELSMFNIAVNRLVTHVQHK